MGFAMGVRRTTVATFGVHQSDFGVCVDTGTWYYISVCKGEASNHLY